MALEGGGISLPFLILPLYPWHLRAVILSLWDSALGCGSACSAFLVTLKRLALLFKIRLPSKLGSDSPVLPPSGESLIARHLSLYSKSRSRDQRCCDSASRRTEYWWVELWGLWKWEAEISAPSLGECVAGKEPSAHQADWENQRLPLSALLRAELCQVGENIFI